MSSRRLFLALSLCAAFALASPARPAWAGGKLNVVILDFKGQKKLSERCEKVIKQAVRRKHSLIPLRTYERALKRLRIKRGRNSDFARIASAIGADAIVGAKVIKRRKRRTLQIKVREGASGKVVETVYVPLRSSKVKGKTRKRLRREVFEVLAWVEPLAKPVEVEERVAEPEPEEVLEEEVLPEPDDEEPVRHRRRRVAQESDEEEIDHEERSKSHDDDESPLTHESADKAYEGSASIGISVIGRDLTFTVQPSIPTEQQPMSYQGTPVGAAQLNGEVFPLLHSKGLMRNLGISVSLQKAIRLRSRVATQGEAHEFDTEQSRYRVGVRYRVPLGKSTFRLAAGYMKMNHQINSGGVDLDLPNVSYSCVELGGGLRVPLSPGKVSLGADALYLHVLDAGEITAPDAYGNATIQGVDIDAHLAYMASDRMVIRGGVQYVRMGFAFDGSGAMTQLDSSPDQDVGGAADTWLGGYVTAGVIF